jgi:magnesium-transporting ATPase (P-type)/membrane-associated phospholipid phosphatase
VTNLLLAVLAGVLAAIGAAGWWVSGHPEEINSFFQKLRHDPRLLAFRDRHRAALEFLLRRLRPEGAAGVFLSAGLIALAASAIAFGGVLQDVVAHDELARFDSPILTFITSHRVGWLTTAMRAISLLGAGPVVALVVVGAGLAFRRLWHLWEPLLILAVAAGGAELLSLSVRAVVARPRPPVALMASVAHGYGFPSGQATRSILYGALAYLLGAKLPRWQARVRVWVAAAMVAFLVGASPVYLGWNWPTDALAGWALAASWLAIVVTTTTAIRRLRGASPGAEAGTSPSPAPLEVDSALSAPKRPRTDPGGLSEAQVRERIERGETNRTEERSSRSVGEILRANILTRFNAILGSLAVVIVLTGSLKDALFALVLVANTVIGIVQELRAKLTLDRLVVLAAPTARVVRDGEVKEVPVAAIVLDDVLELSAGDQIPVDGVVLESADLEVDESLLTGEAEPVLKAPGDVVLSGSFVVAGSSRIQATRVGDAAYARRLAAEGRRFAPPRSQLQAGIDRLLAYITWALVPTAVILFAGQLRAHIGLANAIRGSVAGVVGMVPEGLVLLSSTAMALSVVRLARKRVLIQELQAVEGLARVDVLCCDKTGTVTDGSIKLDEVLPASESEAYSVREALGALAAAATSRNATLEAIAACRPPEGEGWKVLANIAFSSARKWSGATFAAHGTWVLGAPEIVLAHLSPSDPVRAEADRLAAEGRRVVALARGSALLSQDTTSALPPGLVPAGLVVLSERIRPEAAATFRYFAEQGVALKIVSGDNPRTVAAVAAAAGLIGVGDPQDARSLPADPEALAEALERHSVFGRVTPRQKREMIAALRRRGHSVAMTGDGVNDVLALKEADLGIAMGSGTAATRAVAKAILLDNDFATLPAVVAEGRRVIANVERTGSLFVTKTVYVFALALAVGLIGVAFPFLPRHLTLAGSLTIGIPGFFLALEPNTTRSRLGFLSRILRFAIPAGAIAAAATLAAYALARQLEPAHLDVARTVATITLTACGLSILALLAPPRVRGHYLLIAGLAGSLLACLVIPGLRTFFALRLPSLPVWVALAVVVAAAHVFLQISSRGGLRSGQESLDQTKTDGHIP